MQYILQKCSFGDSVARLSYLDLSKNMAPRERGLFSLYIFIENFKNLLVRNHWTDFIITWQKCFHGDPLPRLSNSDSSKNMAAGGWSLFSLYIENLKKIFLSETTGPISV